MDEETTPREEHSGPLAGIRVLDMSRILAGPFCTQLLGDLGADVIKVERPGHGDDTRKWGPPFVTAPDGSVTEESAYYLSANRNKRSIAVDMASAEGAETLRKIADRCDVVIENFKVGTMERFGLDYETLSARNPGLVYCSITGFGQTGPNAHKPGYDLVAQAEGGIMSLTGPVEGPPMKVGVAIADVMCGMYAANAVQAALLARQSSGKGQHIDVALMDTQVAWLINEAQNYLVSGIPPVRRGNEHPNIVPYQVFECADGHVAVAVGNDTQFKRFCEAIDRADLAIDPRYANNPSRLEHREGLTAEISVRLRALPRAEVVERLELAGVPTGPIASVPEVFSSEQVAARGMKVSMRHGSGADIDLVGNPLKFSRTPASYRRPPPRLGEHTSEVLAELLGPEGVELTRPS